MTTANRQRHAIVNVIGKLALLSIPLSLIGTWAVSYLNGFETAVIALDANSGKFQWSSVVDESLAKSIVTEKDRVFVATAMQIAKDEYRRKYQLTAFSGKSGQKLWSLSLPEVGAKQREDLENMAVSTPIHQAHGDRLWLNTVSDRLPSKQPVIDSITNEKSILTNFDLKNIRQGKVSQIDALTGKLNWSIDRNWNSRYAMLDSIATNNLTTAILRVNPADISLEAYDSATGKWRWQSVVSHSGATSRSTFARYQTISHPDTLFLADRANNKLLGYNWDTGKLKFQTSVERLLISSVNSSSPGLDGFVNGGSKIYSLTLDGKIIAFDPKTGTRSWVVDSPHDRKSQYPLATMADRTGIYLICRSRSPNDVKNIDIFSIDSKTGKKNWFKQYPNPFGRVWSARDLVSNSKTVYGVLDDVQKWERDDTLIALANVDGKQRWEWQAKFRLYQDTIAVDDDRLFILALVPRWRIILGAID
jgi:outer membrane protein assembly factor BamB